MSANALTTFLPPELWGVHPFYSSIVKLFNIYLDSGTSPLLVTDTSSSSSTTSSDHTSSSSSSFSTPKYFLVSDPTIYDSHYLYGLHPINTVAVGGTIVMIENKENRTIMWIDDGTGIVQTIFYHQSITVIHVPPTLPIIPSNTSYTTAGTPNLSSSSRQGTGTRTMKDTCSLPKFRIGDMVILHGNIGWGNRSVTYTGLVRQIYIHRIYLLTTMDKLIEFWSDTLRLHQEIYRKPLHHLLPTYISIPSNLKLSITSKSTVLPWIVPNDTSPSFVFSVPIVSLSPSISTTGTNILQNLTVSESLQISTDTQKKKSKFYSSQPNEPYISSSSSFIHTSVTNNHPSNSQPHELLIQFISIIEKLIRQYHPHSRRDKIVIESQRQKQQKLSRHLNNYTALSSSTAVNLTNKYVNRTDDNSDEANSDDSDQMNNEEADDDDNDDDDDIDEEMNDEHLYKDYLDNNNNENENQVETSDKHEKDSDTIMVVPESKKNYDTTSSFSKEQLLNALSSGTWIMNESVSVTGTNVSSTNSTITSTPVTSEKASVPTIPLIAELPVYFTIHDIYVLVEKYHTDFLDTFLQSLTGKSDLSSSSVQTTTNPDRSTILLLHIFDILQQLCKDGLIYVTSYSLTTQLQQQYHSSSTSSTVFYGLISYDYIIRPVIQKILTNVYHTWHTKIQEYDQYLRQKDGSSASSSITTDNNYIDIPAPPSEPTITHNDLLMRMKVLAPELQNLPNVILQRSITLLEKEGYFIIIQPYVYMPMMEMINEEMRL